MTKFGFSTGAIAYSDFRKAIEILQEFDFPAIELSALREPELPVLLGALSQLDLSSFEYISFHAPSSIDPGNENEVNLYSDKFRWNIQLYIGRYSGIQHYCL